MIINKENIEEKINQRFDYIDRLRDIAIILVVMGHIIQYNIVDGQNKLLYSIIYSFHMPLFMFISGYTLEKFIKITSFNSSFSFVLKKSHVLLLPLFSWAVLRTIFDNSLDFSIFYKIYEIVIEQITSPSLWFLHTLFLLMLFYIVFYWFSLLLNKSKNIFIDLFLIIIELAVIFAFLKLFFSKALPMSFILYLIFFMSGIMIIRYKSLLNILLNKYINEISLLFFVVVVGNYNFIQSDLFIMKIYKIIISFLAIVVLYNFVQNKIINNSLIDNFIIRCGKSSLAIYIIHFSFVNIYFIHYDVNLFLLFISTLFVSILIIVPILYVEKGIKKNRYISYFLLGTSIKTITKEIKCK